MSLKNLRSDLKKASNPEKAKVVARFFKTGKGEYGEGDIFIGVTVPNSWIIARKYKDISFIIVQQLIRSKIHEERLTALMILVLQFSKTDQKIQKKIYEFYLKNTKYINNWDLVDISADHIVGGWLLGRHPGKPKAHPGSLRDSGVASFPRMTVLNKLARSKNIWERRIAIIAAYEFIRHKQFEDTLKISELLLNDSHDLIHKAVGWMLREVGNRDRAIEEKFLKKHYRKMPRTMLRYAIEKFPKDLYFAYLHGTV